MERTIKIYNWGIIGLGKIAHKFATDLQQLQQAKLWAVAATDKERAAAFAKKFDVENYFDNYEAILKSGIDILYIATPNSLHAEWTIKGLQHKIAILVEKPFAINYPQATQMHQAAQRNNTFLMEAMWTRFLPTTKKLLSIIEEGQIGHVISIKADFCFNMPFDPNHRAFNLQLGGGSLLDIGIYPVYLSYLLLGMPVDAKVITTKSKTKVDESCAILLKYPGNQFADLQSSFAYTSKVEAFVYGTSGSIHIRPRFHGLSSGIEVTNNNGETIDYPFEWDCLGYKYEALEVMNCLENNLVESELHPIDTSMELCRLLDAIRISGNIVYPTQDGVTNFDELENINE